MAHERAQLFLASFNRIDKWLQRAVGPDNYFGFSDAVRKQSKSNGIVAHYAEDLLEMAQLRNAIVHNQVQTEFILAEPNQWVVDRLSLIEQALNQPKRVGTQFAKKVITFEMDAPLSLVFEEIKKTTYSQFPIYERGVCRGLITVHGVGLWIANFAGQQQVNLVQQTLNDILKVDRRKDSFQVVNHIFLVEDARKLFIEKPRLEAILITKSGELNQQPIGLIRPKDFLLLDNKL